MASFHTLSANRRNRAALFAVLAGFAVALQLSRLLQTPVQMIVRGVFIDEAYNYAVIARNFIHLGFFTFDGEQPTNGFHPLWMGLLTGILSIVKNSDALTILARLSWAVFVLFAVTISYYVMRWKECSQACGFLAVAALILFNTNFQQAILRGLETPLVLLLLSIFLCAARTFAHPASEKERRAACFALGLCSALIFLARVDLFWAPAISFAWVWRSKRSWRDAALFALPVVCLSIPYLWSNVYFYGALMPISGQVKRFYFEDSIHDLHSYFHSEEWKALPVMLWYVLWPAALNAGRKMLIVLGCALLLAVYALRRGKHPAKIPAEMSLLNCICAAHLFFMYLWYRETRAYSAYYFVPEALAIALLFSHSVACRCGESSSGNGRRAIALTLLALWTTVCAANNITVKLNPTSSWQSGYEIAAQMNELLPAHPRIAAYWPGLAAYVYQGPVIALDGIVGSGDYFNHFVRTHRQLDYMREKKCPYLLVFLDGGLEALQSSAAIPDAKWGMRGQEELRRVHAAGWKVALAVPQKDKTDGSGFYLFERTD